MKATADLIAKMTQFDRGRDAAKRDREIYGRPFPYGAESDFGQGYWHEWNRS